MHCSIYIITHNIFIITIISSLHFKCRYLHLTLDYNFRVPTRNFMYLLKKYIIKYNNNLKYFRCFWCCIGTFSSGMLCLCVGKPRFTVNDTFQSRVGAFCVNFVVAAAQLFTVLFCLVGWGWSIWWGVIMLKMASKSSLPHVKL